MSLDCSWVPRAGLDLALRMDGLGVLFVLLILGIGLLVILYSHYYLSGEESVGRFFSLFLLFMGRITSYNVCYTKLLRQLGDC